MTKDTRQKDLRIRRTHFLLKQALQELLTRKALEEISVKEICSRAMVHRGTFYKHYQDKYHLFSAVLDDITETIRGNTPLAHDPENPAALYIDFAGRALNYVTANRETLKKTIKRNRDDLAYLMIFHAIQDCITGLLKSHRDEGEYTLPVEVISRFTTTGLTALVFYWIETEEGTSPEQMMDMVKTIIHQNLYLA